MNTLSAHATHKLADCLEGIDFLRKLKPAELEQLTLVTARRTFSAGTAIYKQGDKADAFYLVASGRLSVWQRTGFQSQRVGSLKEDQYFGDNSLLSDCKHHASVVAETDCELYVLYKGDFEAILMGNPGVANAIKAHVTKIRLGGHA